MKQTSTLLINGPVLTIQADLAVAVGLEQAIILQQLHWWLEQRRNLRDGRYWVYNTYEDWHKQFPFIAVRSLKRIITQMEADGLLLAANYNQHKTDRTKWYSINYDHAALTPSDDSRRPSGQSGTLADPVRHDVDSAKVDRSVPNVSKELTTETDDHHFALYHGRSNKLTTPQALALAARHTHDGKLNRDRFMAEVTRR